MVNTSEHTSLVAALAAIQAKMPHVGKDNTAQMGTYSYSYADLTEITTALLPLLSAQGLAWTTAPTLNDAGAFVLRYALTHTSGESTGGDYPLGSATAPPQQMGSAVTYARRYALCAVTGLAPGGEDDDASAAQRGAEQATEPTYRTVPPVANAVAKLATVTNLEDIDRMHEFAVRYHTSGSWSDDDFGAFVDTARVARERVLG